MKKIIIVILTIIVANSFILAKPKQVDKVPYYLTKYTDLYKKSPREASLAWFDDARLGMFIHWGVWTNHHAAWAMFNELIPLNEYQQIAREFDASGFDANQIVKLAEASGMHYITFVAKHHDGFCLWNSKATVWDSWDYPVHRDFLGELAKVCQKRGMPLFVYYSIGIDWTHPYYLPQELYSVGRPHYKVKPDYFLYKTPADFEKYREFCKQQLTELCTQYGPIAGLWFDTLGGVLANSEMFNMQEFYDLIHKLQPQALINFKTGATGTEDILVGERELKSISMHYGNSSPQDIRIRQLADHAWEQNFNKKAEIAVTSQGTWEWSPTTKCLPSSKLWKMLEMASNNNANLLLNFSPMPNGTIPEDVVTNFRLLGEQIKKDGYPTLNTTTYLQLRKTGDTVDANEKVKTAR